MVRPGFGFMRDGASLGMLREMLVMIRIWGLLKPGCLPTFTATFDNQDSMQLLFRLLTKLWLCCKRLLIRVLYRSSFRGLGPSSVRSLDHRLSNSRCCLVDVSLIS